MKILYLANYRDGTGYAQASLDYILALDAAGVEVVCRPFCLNSAKPEVPARIYELEARSARGADAVIQHTLPQYFDYNGSFAQNIGLYASETSSFCDSVWTERINTLDRAWVINKQMSDAARQSGVHIPVSVVPHTTNVERFMRSYQPLEVLKPHREAGDFIFYFIGELVRRKNIVALLQAFHSEFDPAEPVQLCIKTSQAGVPAEAARHRLSLLTDEIKAGLKLHGGKLDRYKQEIVITDRLTETGIMRLHAACDCFVMPSYGEAWCQPAFDAMAMGKTPIVTACTGFLDYLSSAEGTLVPCRAEPCYGAADTFIDLYTANENWWSIDVLALRNAMRSTYEVESVRSMKAANGVRRAHDFSYQKIGQQMRELLHGELA